MMNNTNQPTAKHQQGARELDAGRLSADGNPEGCGDPVPSPPERLYAQVFKTGNVYAYDYNPCEVHDNGKPVYEYVHASALSSRDREIREVLEGLRDDDSGCWCVHFGSEYHTNACLAARGLWERVQG